MNPSLLLVEDDRELCLELSDFLVSSGFAVRCAMTLGEARAELTVPPELMVVDLNLPDGNGLDLCHEFAGRRIGIVVCTARDERELRIDSLRDGVDAYLVKPVDPDELAATLLSVHRRVDASAPNAYAALLSGALPTERPWRLDRVGRLLTSPTGVAVLVSASECALLATLFGDAARFATREQLLARIEGEANDSGSTHRLDALISRLRRKVDDKSGMRLPLRSAYGRGYEFTAHALLDG